MYICQKFFLFLKKKKKIQRGLTTKQASEEMKASNLKYKFQSQGHVFRINDFCKEKRSLKSTINIKIQKKKKKKLNKNHSRK